MSRSISSVARTSILILLTALVASISCKTGTKDDGKTYNKTYSIGVIPNIDSFYTLKENEKRIDSMEFQFKDVTWVKEFRSNRGRVFAQTWENGKPAEQDESLSTGMPMPCRCYVSNDSIIIDMSIGFFGGASYEILVMKDSFQSQFVTYADNIKPYKSHRDDTAFSGEAVAKSKYQHLLLSEKPTFRPGQQLTGFLTFTTYPYYEEKFGSLDSIYEAGRIFFTCATRKYSLTRWNKQD
jgi:hypothetical protein